MRATLHVVSETGARRRLEVRDGQVARFGRSEWADYSFPDDQALADVHFVVECAPTGAVLRDLGTGRPTQLNGQSVAEAVLRPGDRIAAGRTTWTVELEGSPTAEADNTGGQPVAAARPAQSAQQWVALLSDLGVADEALAVPRDDQTADELVAALLAAEQFAAAAQLRAHQLQPRGAVWWGYEVVGLRGIETRPARQQAGLATVCEWVAQPDEARRRECEKQAVALNYQGPGGFLAAAAFFSGDNVAPPDCPTPTPPDPHLSGRLVTALLLIEVAQTLGEPPAVVWKRVLDMAAQLLEGPICWPAPTSGA